MRDLTDNRGAAASAVDLVKIYGKDEAQVRALDGVTVDLMRGEFTAVMGPSGTGRTTNRRCRWCTARALPMHVLEWTRRRRS